MTTADLVNRIIEKFGGNRVRFTALWPMLQGVTFEHAQNLYDASANKDGEITVRRYADGCIQSSEDDYSCWVQGVLNGMTRNEAGELVEVKGYE